MRHNKAIFILSKNLAQVLLNCPLPEAVAPRRLAYQLLWGEGWSVSDTVESRVPKLLPFFFFLNNGIGFWITVLGGPIIYQRAKMELFEVTPNLWHLLELILLSGSPRRL